MSNSEVLDRIEAGKEMIWIVNKKVKMIRHNLRHSWRVSFILEKINWVRRPKQSYDTQIMKNTGCRSHSEMKRLAQDWEKWRAAAN